MKLSAGSSVSFSSLRLTILLSFLASACTGSFFEGGSSDREGGDPNGALHEIACRGAAEPTLAPLARFAVSEYEQGLRAVVGDAAVDAARRTLDGLPADASESPEGFDRQDHRLSDRHVQAYYQVADEIAGHVANDATLRAEVAGACAASDVDDTCLRTFAPAILRRALRRPATSDEIARAISAASDFSGTDRVHAVLFTALMAPDFMYRFENRGEKHDDELELTAYEVASRLSYHFWGGPPDEALLGAAERGDLDSDDGYATEVDRIYEDPRTEATLVRFFTEWLRLERGDFTPSPRLEALRDGIPISGLSVEMREEVLDLLRYHLGQANGSWRDVLTSPFSFARTERLAAIYGTPVWDGASAPPRLPDVERSGLLTRAGLLYSSDGSTNPFRRGIFVRRTLLCDDVPPPPANIPASALTPPPVEAGATTREGFEAKIVNQPCAGCHAQFAPFGYALEAFDGLGRYRADERLVTAEGENLGTAGVDTRVIPRIDAGDARPIDTALELNERIADSPKANECLAVRYFRFAYRREEVRADECTIGSLLGRLEAGEPLRDALRSVALEPAFRRRLIEQE